MEWFDMTWGPSDEPGGILELSETLLPPGLALELHLYVLRDGTFAVWILEDGTVAREAAVGAG